MLKHIKSREDWNEKTLGAKGFTLIELLVVIVILGILAAVVVFAVGGITDKGQRSACVTEDKTVRTAAEAYFASPNLGNGVYGSMANMTAAGSNLLSAAPTLVTYTPAGNSYAMAWAGVCSTGTFSPALPTP